MYLLPHNSLKEKVRSLSTPVVTHLRRRKLLILLLGNGVEWEGGNEKDMTPLWPEIVSHPPLPHHSVNSFDVASLAEPLILRDCTGYEIC